MEELIFRTVVDTGKSVKDTEKLKDALSDVGKESKGAGDKGAEALAALNARVEEGNYTMKEAAKIAKEYATIALQAGRETPVGQEAIKQAGELKDKIGDLRVEMANAGTDGANLKASLQLASTVTAGYGAVKGMMALTGVESEALAQTFVKLQAVQAVLTGIESVRAALEKESLLVTKSKVIWTKVMAAGEYIYSIAVGTTTGAVKALRIAMMALPIVAIIAAIVALVVILAEFFSSEKKAEEMNRKLNESFAEQNRLLEINERVYKRNSDNKRALMVAEGADADQLFAFDRQRLMDEEVLRRKNLAALKANMEEKKAAMHQAAKEANVDLTKQIGDELVEQAKKYDELREMDSQYGVDVKLLEDKRAADKKKDADDAAKDLAQKQKEWAKKAEDERARQAQVELDQQRLLEDLLVANITDADARKIAQLKLQQQREMQEDVKKYGDKSAVIAQLTIRQAADRKALQDEIAKQAEADQKAADKKVADDRKAAAETQRKNDKAELEGKLIQVREDFDATIVLKKELALEEMDAALEAENLTEGERFKIKQEYAQKIDDLNEQVANKEKERQKQVQAAAINVMKMGVDAAQNLADAFFDYKISKAAKGSAAELEIEKRKFEVNKKLQIAQAIMQGIQATLAAYASGAAIPVVGVVAGPAFAAAAGITAALNVAKIKNTTFESSSGSTSTPSASAPSVSAPQSNQQETSTLTAHLPGNSNTPNKVVMVDSDLKAALQDNSQVSVVSNIG